MSAGQEPAFRVDVVIPARNAEKFIAAAVGSVLDQTYPHVHCIVVDDASEDATAEIAGSCGDRVTVIRRRPRSGVSGARNIGIAASEGEFIAFLDADDIWLPTKISKQIETLLRQPEVGLVYTGLHLIDDEGNFIGRIDPPKADEALRNTLLLEPPVLSIAQTGLVRRAVLDAVGGFDEGLSTSADCDLTCRIAARFAVVPVPEPLALYRQHRGQMHLDPDATHHDMEVIFKRFFGGDVLPAELRGMRARAEANLKVSLAGKYRMMGDRARFLRLAASVALRRPDRFFAAVHRLTRPDPATGDRRRA